MAKLNQIIAIEKGVKSRTYSEITELNKIIQKPELFNGFSKTYQSNDEDGEQLPGESKRVQFTVTETLRTVERSLSELIDLTARKDWTNCVAKSDVVVNGEPLFTGAPVSFLLFLEKQLTDMRTFVSNLPTLDYAENWTADANSGLFKTDVTKTHRTRKVQKPIVLYPATPEHPAQTQMVTEDVIAGYWSQTRQSGARPWPEISAMGDRIEKLLHAIKQAREAANVQDEVPVPNIAEKLFRYILEG